jgi:AcrR family transcriptional regulator
MNDPKLKILHESKDLFERFGYQKTTLTDIARSVGKVKTAIYYYFSGKEEIFADLVKLEAEDFLNKLIAAVSAKDVVIEQLESYVRTRVDLMQKISTRYSFLKREFFELMPIVEANRKKADAQEIALITDLLERLNKIDDYTVQSPHFSANMLVNTLKGLEVQMYVTDQIHVEALNIDQFCQFVLYGVVTKS